MPRLVRVYSVGRNRNDLGVRRLELRVQLRELFKLGRAYEGEVRGVEDEHRPLTTEFGETHRLNRAIVIDLKLKVGHRLAHLHLRGVVTHGIMELATILTVVTPGLFHICTDYVLAMIPSRLMTAQTQQSGVRHLSAGVRILCIVGPTASGKSSRAVEEAFTRGGEIISVDSRQVYRGLDVGTEKITAEEMRGVPHHLIDIRDPSEPYSAGDFVNDTTHLIQEISGRGKLPILVGGTHFYFDALFSGLPSGVDANPQLRQELEALPTQKLFARIKEEDARRAAELDPMNRRRLIRALEIIESLGSVPFRIGKVRPSEGSGRSDLPVEYVVEWIVIDPPREELRARIDARLANALKRGLIEEVRRVRELVGDARLNELGLEYKIVGEYLRGERDEASLLPTLSAKLWQYARRQKAWLRKLGHPMP